MDKNKDMQFFIGNLKIEKEKGQNNFNILERGFEPQIFSNIPAQDLNFNVKLGAQEQTKTSF